MYNPFVITKKILDDLRAKTKKGSKYVNSRGQLKERSDFERGVAMGRLQLLCEQAKYYNETNKATKKENKTYNKKNINDNWEYL